MNKANIEVMNFQNKVQRAFYRSYILPLHIAKREGAEKKSLEDELKQHQAFLKGEGLVKEAAEYRAGQKARQKAYDDWKRAASQNSEDTIELELAFRQKAADFARQYEPARLVQAEANLEAIKARLH